MSGSEYAHAFDAALETARSHGLDGTLRDRRAGVIETEPRIAGSLFEPWRVDNADFTQGVKNTLAFQRRRARFEFVAAGMAAAMTESDSSDAPDTSAAGPDVVGIEQAQVDLTQHEGPLELRVWVYLERAQTPGLRRSTWTRRATHPSKIITPEGEAPLADSTFWVPVKRDVQYERRLLADVQKRLHAAHADDPSDPQPAPTESLSRSY